VLVISQKDINAPVIQNVLINEIGGTWTGTYDAVGNYTLNNSDTSLVFLNATTAIFYTDGDNTIPGEVAFYNNGSNIRIATWNSAGVATDEILYGFLEIRQYI
jgi:predicted metalloprotease with PDZ domain